MVTCPLRSSDCPLPTHTSTLEVSPSLKCRTVMHSTVCPLHTTISRLRQISSGLHKREYACREKGHNKGSQGLCEQQTSVSHPLNQSTSHVMWFKLSSLSIQSSNEHLIKSSSAEISSRALKRKIKIFLPRKPNWIGSEVRYYFQHNLSRNELRVILRTGQAFCICAHARHNNYNLV